MESLHMQTYIHELAFEEKDEDGDVTVRIQVKSGRHAEVSINENQVAKIIKFLFSQYPKITSGLIKDEQRIYEGDECTAVKASVDFIAMQKELDEIIKKYLKL